jgi:DUF4097 and DUF4098 domain-containing protein YvlB
VNGDQSGCQELIVDAGSGGVQLSRVSSSSIKIEAGSGGIELGLTSSPRDVRIEAGSGNVTLGMPASLSAELDLKTGSGSISTDFPVRTTRMERDHLRGTVGDGAGRIRVEAGSGSIRLRRN